MIEFPPVLSKRDFVNRYAAGEFGNASPTWTDPAAFERDSYPGPCHLRNGVVAGGQTHFYVPGCNILELWRGKTRPGDWFVSAQIPDDIQQTLTVQGEVMRDERGLYLYYTRVKTPMREALAKEAHHAERLTAKMILEHYLCPNSYEWIQVLLERYQDHVVEFSTFGRCWGTIPGYNTVFWETRKY